MSLKMMRWPIGSRQHIMISNLIFIQLRIFNLIAVFSSLPIICKIHVYIYSMPRYVAKEDVEKGLVDPTRPLEEQPQYKQKIDQEQGQHKQKHQEQKNQHQRPKKERPPRNERPKFNWNKNQVTIDSKAPEKPKKLLEKPNAEKYRTGLEKLKAERQTLKLQRSVLIDEQRSVIRDITESKKQGRENITQYSGAMKDKFVLQNQLRKEIRHLDDYKKKINSEIEYFTAQANELKKPSNKNGYSVEYLNREIEYKEHELMTANIDKRQEAKLSNQINELKRAIPKARPSIQIDSQLKKIEDQIDLLYRQVKPIKHELHIKITQANGIRAELDALKEQRKSEEGQAKIKRTPEQIKAEYQVKFKALEQRRDKLEDKIDDYVDKHVREVDQYEDQQDLLKYIVWFESQIEWCKKKKEEQQKRKKEREEYEKKKLKEKQEYEKRQQQRKKHEEQRKAREQERKKKLAQERERYISRNPHHEIIDLCDNLIGYCESLKPNVFSKSEDPRSKQAGQLKFGKEWQGEIKKVQVIVSKKSKADEEVTKKPLKQKKKQQKPEDEDFVHGIDIVNQFQTVKLLPPNNAAEIDSTIKLIRDKISFYNNPTEEQKAIFRQKATKEFDERHAPRQRRENKDYKQREPKQFKQKAQEAGQPKDKKPNQPPREKKQLKEQDFPEIK